MSYGTLFALAVVTFTLLGTLAAGLCLRAQVTPGIVNRRAESRHWLTVSLCLYALACALAYVLAASPVFHAGR